MNTGSFSEEAWAKFAENAYDTPPNGARTEGQSLAAGRIKPTKNRRPFIFGPSSGSPSM